MNGGISRMEEESFIERRRIVGLKECGQLIDEDRYGKEGFKRIFQSQFLLDKFFSLFDTDRDNYLIQEDWIEFLKARLTNENQHDFVDQIESVAYVCCRDEPIDRQKFHQIFTTKGILDKLFRLMDEENSGTLTRNQIMQFFTNITRSRPHPGLDKNNVQMLEKLFKQTVGDENKEINREEFKKIVISKNPFFTERVFQIFDRDGSGSITLQEFLDAMLEFAGKTADDKIRFLFKVYDIDGDGLIQLRELGDVMRACMIENGMEFSEEQIQQLTMALFADADQGNRGAITFEAMKKQLERHDGLLENLTISIDRWLVPSRTEPTGRASISKILPYQLTKPYVKNNYVYIGFIVIFLTINAILFFSRIIHYRHANGFVILARASGQCLNLDSTFVLILMLRQCITFLRTHGFISILPLDHHIYLHKITGIFILVLGAVHAIAHLLNFAVVDRTIPIKETE